MNITKTFWTILDMLKCTRIDRLLLNIKFRKNRIPTAPQIIHILTIRWPARLASVFKRRTYKAAVDASL
ncbi:hypothetical protein T4E_2335 [Trichinella pseudospiralis]|uniref:Uncharacterized protein n=1 Tax=Trichinella pseudospiralis TaxID=6337 RepID=A0A0V0WE50_TRIPS|nr:hypothetical protein T4E_2335 [Trichinella pseudospiralis]